MLTTVASFIIGIYVSQEYSNYVPNIQYAIHCIKSFWIDITKNKKK